MFCSWNQKNSNEEGCVLGMVGEPRTGSEQALGPGVRKRPRISRAPGPERWGQI